MLKNYNIVFPPKLCQILPSLLVRPMYKTHLLLVAISVYKVCRTRETDQVYMVLNKV